MAGLSYRATYLFLFHFIMDWENVEIEHELEMSKAYGRDWAKHHGIHLDSAFSRASRRMSGQQSVVHAVVVRLPAALGDSMRSAS